MVLLVSRTKCPMSWKEIRLYAVVNLLFACGKFQVFHIYVANNAEDVITAWINGTSVADGLSATQVHYMWTIVVVVFFVGAAVACFAFAWFADYLGRRCVLYLVCGVQLCAMCLTVDCLYNANYVSLLLQRAAVGVAYGLGNSVSVLYCLEVVPSAHRGTYMALSIAHLHLSSVLATGLTLPQFLGAAGVWQYAFLVGSAPALLLLLLLPFIPESPRYAYSTRGDDAECWRILLWLHPEHTARHIHTQIHEEQQLSNELGETAPVSFGQLVSEPVLRETTRVCVWLVLLLSFGGLFVYNTMSTLLFEKAGLDHREASEATVLLMASKTLPVVALVFLSDWIGRRRLVYVGACLCTAGQLALTALEYQTSTTHAHAVATVCAMMVWAYGSRCVHTVVHTVPGELYPQQARAKGTALIWTGMLMCQGLSIVVYVACLNIFGLPVTNMLFTMANPVMLVFVYRNLPETAQRSFHDIQSDMKHRVEERAALVLKQKK